MSLKLINKKVLTSSFGNVLEWFDFGLFIFMAPIFGVNFFPASSPHIALINSLVVFAAGFLFRPLGGIIFAHFGDTQGRAVTLKISILLITLSTFLIGLIPSYQTLGISATVLFVLLRLIQGISVGGEYSGIMVYLSEIAPVNRKGFVTSFAAFGANAGFLMATAILMLLNKFFTSAAIHQWAWRLPFIFAGLLGSIIAYFRFKFEETLVYKKLEESNQLISLPLYSSIKNSSKSVLQLFLYTCLGASFYYVFFGFMPNFLEIYLGIKPLYALMLQSFSLILMLFIVPLAGLCGDLLSRKLILTLVSLSVILFAIPAFYLLETKSIPVIACVLLIATIISSFEQGNSLTAVVENCPLNVRQSTIGFAYNFGNALFGGTAPLMVSLMTNKLGIVSPAYYLIMMAAIGLMTVLTFLPNNQEMACIEPA